jgi:hypothetical protein
MKNKIKEISLTEAEIEKIKKSFFWPVICLVLFLMLGFYIAIASVSVILSMVDETMFRIALIVLTVIILMLLQVYPLNGISKRIKDLRENKKIVLRGMNFTKKHGGFYYILMDDHKLSIPRSFYTHIQSKDLVEIHFAPCSGLVFEYQVIR